MRLEWEPTSSLCNNVTFDWLLQTMLSQVTKQNEDLSSSNEELQSLTDSLSNKDDTIRTLEAKVTIVTIYINRLP